MILKLGMKHWGLKLYKVYINDDPGLTLTFFTARSNWVICTFAWQGSHRPGKVLEFDLGPEKLLEFQNTAICPGIL